MNIAACPSSDGLTTAVTLKKKKKKPEESGVKSRGELEAATPSKPNLPLSYGFSVQWYSANKDNDFIQTQSRRYCSFQTHS